jgi:superfamily II RNA helicase
LIELLLRHSAENRQGFESDLLALIGERQASPATPAHPPVVERPRHTAHGRPHAAHHEPEHHEPAATLAAWLEGIGVPPPQPFVPDPWQEEALAKLQQGDVIVSVPTGSGKTYVAVEAARRAMEENRTVIYTSPLKALSNTK